MPLDLPQNSHKNDFNTSTIKKSISKHELYIEAQKSLAKVLEMSIEDAGHGKPYFISLCESIAFLHKSKKQWGEKE
jgi:hypothetical protein